MCVGTCGIARLRPWSEVVLRVYMLKDSSGHTAIEGDVGGGGTFLLPFGVPNGHRAGVDKVERLRDMATLDGSDCVESASFRSMGLGRSYKIIRRKRARNGWKSSYCVVSWSTIMEGTRIMCG